MNYMTWLFIVALTCFFNRAGFAAEIIVPPGNGTLSAAIASAANGDTLVLEDGAYNGAVTVDKSLTLRARNRATEVLLTDDMTILGAGITVTVQGLTFDSKLVLQQAAAIQILENYWVTAGGSIDAIGYSTAQGDGTLIVVGNRFNGGGIYDIRSEDAYIAGNTFFSYGQIETHVSAWIVGNEIHGTQAIIALTGAIVRVIGNRLICTYTTSIVCADVRSTLSLVANNVVEVHDPDTNTAANYSHTGIQAFGDATVINNVIRGTPVDQNRPRNGTALYAPYSGRVAGNIVLDYVSSSTEGPIFIAGTTEANNNLCFNNSNSCPTGNGNLNADPKFVDLVDYHLAANSPAINAGPPDFSAADLDRTRNDMGIHGGPWSIAQYDAQRDPNNLAPYAYPLFKANAAIGGGALDLQALGVAKLR